MSGVEKEITAICNQVFDERKGELSPAAGINSPWLTEMQLAEYWQLRNKDGELTVHSIRDWTKRAENPLPCANMGEMRRYQREEVDKWAWEEAARQRGNSKRKGRNGLRDVSKAS
jgi:hypothetical protein